MSQWGVHFQKSLHPLALKIHSIKVRVICQKEKTRLCVTFLFLVEHNLQTVLCRLMPIKFSVRRGKREENQHTDSDQDHDQLAESEQNIC